MQDHSPDDLTGAGKLKSLAVGTFRSVCSVVVDKLPFSVTKIERNFQVSSFARGILFGVVVCSDFIFMPDKKGTTIATTEWACEMELIHVTKCLGVLPPTPWT